jgi:cytochrome c-type biogenesis protein CcmE
MTRKRQRMIYILTGMASLIVATALVLFALGDSLVFFHGPSEVVEKNFPTDRRFRLGGLVEEGSVVRDEDGLTVRFIVTDLANVIPVTFTGILPDLFRQGQGVVAEGRLRADGVFVATEVLAKHDETYIPADVVDALKAAGKWQGD